jgi:predicted RecB family nuclease
MADFKFDKKGFADLEKHLGQQLKTVETEANKAAARESTPEAKARAFARVLRKHGVENVNEAELRRKFGG